MDVDTIRAGADFDEAIIRALAACKVLLAIIDPDWLTITDERGRPRLEDEQDFVRREIEAALARNVKIIPVLVEDAVMPTRQDLPTSLAGLARRNALTVRHQTFGSDVERLLRSIEDIDHTQTQAQQGPVTGQPEEGGHDWRELVEAMEAAIAECLRMLDEPIREVPHDHDVSGDGPAPGWSPDGAYRRDLAYPLVVVRDYLGMMVKAVGPDNDLSRDLAYRLVDVRNFMWNISLLADKLSNRIPELTGPGPTDELDVLSDSIRMARDAIIDFKGTLDGELRQRAAEQERHNYRSTKRYREDQQELHALSKTVEDTLTALPGHIDELGKWLRSVDY
jgi:hypothetical protein